jgi:hypothetical protein
MYLRRGLRTAWALAAAGASLTAAQGLLAANSDDEIPPWSLALEQRLQPWCPRGCASGVPFTAVYKSGDRILVFVGVHHVFTPRNSTIRAVDSGFAATSAAILIAEGFPTAMGESPAPLVKHASKRGTAEEDQFTKSEGMYAISRAITDGIPFLGGEPTRTEQVQALERRGFTPTDIAFAYLVGGLSQSLRSGDLASSSDPKLAESFAQWSRAFSDQYQLPPLSLEDFKTRYQAVFGVELTRDADPAKRSEPGSTSAVSLLNQTDMVTRDEHLLATIEKELDSKKRVLVVYGGSHWTTLSQALQRRLGKPKITPFVE